MGVLCSQLVYGHSGPPGSRDGLILGDCKIGIETRGTVWSTDDLRRREAWGNSEGKGEGISIIHTIIER